MRCSNYDRMLDPLERCSTCGGSGYHIAIPIRDMNSARTTPGSPLPSESSTSGALGRVRAEIMPWLSAKATKLMHPDRQVQIVFSRPDKQEIFEVLLSLPEADTALRQLMKAYANAIGKGINLCAYPDVSGEQR
jgi:hypothetical protein